MTYTKEQAKQKFGELVERFRYNLDVYKKSSYNEAQVRIEFINPFFEALGWDVSNKQGFAEQYKEVIYEDVIKVGRSTRAPDYSFRIGGQRKFFVEAKKPAVNIKEDVSPAYQLRRYAWSAKLPLSIVTDFEEFSVFDCRIKPNPNDKSSVGRIAYYTFDEYLDSDTFDAIYNVFSKDAVLKGGFDKYAESTKGKKGTAEVDSEFLKEIESWRELLAKNIALRNPEVSIYELNYAVQKIIDRLIFLRICEDRAIEPYGQLQTKAESGDVYMHLLNHFKLAESKYDSGIFDFDSDGITPALGIDDKVLKAIIQDLYYPKSPYEFSVLGVEILGNVYEQFLGKVIRLTAGHQAKVETKPEVKKAGGVYYTPQYIVEYIVENTVGKLIAGKTPEEIAEIKVLDPACGSGSFLIGAYTYLLRYHLDWYVGNEAKKHKRAVFQVRENEWYLITAEKKRILRNNIFGVDTDPQAVEVTKLSLLLKVLEHESRESIDQQAKLGLEGVLPNLGDNIKCGNSLIGPGYYDTVQETLFDEAEMRRVNVFDWDDDKKGFGEIMKRGGFDCVIGNPPYIFARELITQEEKTYFSETYQTIWEKPNTFMIFMEKGLKLLKQAGLLSFIVPNSWLTIESGKLIRKHLLEKFSFEILDDLNYYVFNNAKVESTVFCISNLKNQNQKVKTRKLFSINNFDNKEYVYIKQEIWKTSSKNQKIFISENQKIDLLINKIIENSGKLGKEKNDSGFFDVRTGLQAYETGKGNPKQTKADVKNRIYDYDYKYNKKTHKYIDGVNVKRYYSDWEGKYLLYGERLSQPRTIDIFNRPRILIREITNKPPYCINATYFDELYLNNKSILNVLDFNDNPDNLKLLLGQLNSKLFSFYYKNRAVKSSRKVFPKIVIKDLRKFPFRINVDKTIEKGIISHINHIIETKKRFHSARMERDKELYERQIKMVDTQIDRLVYDLYGLTEEEIGIVEKSP